VAKDEARAKAPFQRTCDGGYAEGCRNLGYMYANGRGVAKDEPRAAALYRQACDGGEAGGCNNLAWFLATTKQPPPYATRRPRCHSLAKRCR
jgi:uncharacterized protein